MKIFSSKNKNKPLAAFSLFRRIGRDPFLDWALVVLVWFLLAVILATSGTMKYFSVIKDISAPPTSVADTIPSLNNSLLDNVLRDFDARASERAGLIKKYPGLGDPSI